MAVDIVGISADFDIADRANTAGISADYFSRVVCPSCSSSTFPVVEDCAYLRRQVSFRIQALQGGSMSSGV